jgi:hypothetical protein
VAEQLGVGADANPSVRTGDLDLNRREGHNATLASGGDKNDASRRTLT